MSSLALTALRAALLLSILGLTHTASAGFRVDYKTGFPPGPPFYATPLYVEGQPITPVVFYHDPDDIPPDSNLLGLDFRAWGSELLMDGFIVFADQNFTVPTHQTLHGEGTPMWFVDTDAYEVIASDGVVTLQELESLDPIKGITTRYHETVHFIGGEAVPFAEGEAQGFLVEGGTFTFKLTEAWLPPDNEHVIIQYKLKLDW